MKYMLSLCNDGHALLRFWFQTNHERKNSASHLKIQAGKTFSYPGHALVTLYVQFMFWLVKIWQVSSCGKCLQHLETCLLCQLKLTESCVNLWCFLLSLSTGCTKWSTGAIKSLLLFMASLFIVFLVQRCVACQSRKSDFGWHRFRFSPCLMRKRVEKSEAIQALLDSFQELHLEW